MRLDKKKIFVVMANRQKNVSQLQRETGISPASLRYAVNGISNTRPETAEKIARALDVDLEEIIS